MRALFWLLGLFTLAVAVVLATRYNDAYALLVWQPWRVQISMNLLALLLLVLFIVGYRVARIVVRAGELPHEVSLWRRQRRREQAQSELHDAERLYREGRFGQAFRAASRAYAGLEKPGIAALLAARAAHAMHDAERRDTWLGHAAAHDRDIRMARLMTEAEMACSERRFDVAATCLEGLKANGHRHLAVTRLAMQVEQGRGRWSEVARLARTLRKHSALSAEQAAPLLRRAQLEQLRDAEGDLAALTRVWEGIPDAERHDTGFLIRAVPHLIGAGDDKLSVEALAQALNKDWDSELASLYGRCQSPDLRNQLALAEGWLKAHPDDAQLLLTLGRLCLRAQLWGKAQSYFEASLSQQETRAAHLELARLAEQLNRPDQAQAHYRAAATLGA